MAKWIICKFCGYKPTLVEKRMLMWKADYCCEDCFKAKLLEENKNLSHNGSIKSEICKKQQDTDKVLVDKELR